jgi:hypothetical protein
MPSNQPGILTLMRHLQYHIGQSFCPSWRHVDILYNGHSEVNVESLSWDCNCTHKAKTIEWCQADKDMEVENQMSRVLQSHNVEPSTIKGVQLVVGGNHGDTVFQFGAEVTIC